MTTLFNRLKNDILTSIQEDGGISGGIDEEQFETMLDKAIFEETHTNVIIHIDGSYNDYVQRNYPLYLDATDGSGMEVYPNEDGDYVFSNVSFDEHILILDENNEPDYFQPYDEEGNFSTYSTYASTFIVSKQKHEYTLHLSQITTQQEI